MPLVCLPGLACDARLFAAQRARFPNLHVPEWLPPLRGDTLESYAGRMSQRLPGGGPLHLLGVSMGSCVAAAMARVVRTESLTLIASATSRASFPLSARAAHFAARGLPSSIFRAGVVAGAGLLARLDAPSDAGARELLVAMARDADTDFCRWVTGAMLAWSPDARPFPCPTLRIHGGRDTVFAARHCAADTRIEPRAGHLVNFTHAEWVNGLVAEHIERAGGR